MIALPRSDGGAAVTKATPQSSLHGHCLLTTECALHSPYCPEHSTIPNALGGLKGRCKAFEVAKNPVAVQSWSGSASRLQTWYGLPCNAETLSIPIGRIAYEVDV